MERNINYKWWHEDWDSIPDEFIEPLEESAMTRIFESLSHGYSEGELFLETENTSFRGYWKITKGDS